MPAPKHLGESTVAGKGISPCSCSAWQFGDPNTAAGSYGIPYDGVIVKSQVKVGALTGSTDTFQPQTAHKTGANAGTVASAGATHNLSGLAGTLAPFYERFPVHAGDVLGARFSTGNFFIEYTNAFFNSPNSTDEIATKTPALAAGESFTGSSNATKERVNVEAWMEPDEDHDGFGDVSQDLCLSSLIGGTACSGSLFGSNFEGVVANSGGAGSDSLYVQTALGGAPTALPVRGVVVRWRLLGIPTSDREFQLRVLAPNGSGGYTIARSSAAETLPKNISAEAGAIGSFATRLQVPSGGYVGIATGPTFTTPTLFVGAPGATMSKLADGADGTSYSGLPTTAASVVGYDADIEPDADGDGYGDASQDSCPTSTSVHDGTCPSAAGGGGSGSASGGPPARPVAPAIDGLSVKPKRFRAKPLGRVAAGGTWGTKLKLKLSAAATVTLTIQSKVGKPLQTFNKSLNRGASSIAFNGQIRRHGKHVDLAPGAYRLSARARNDAGIGATKTASFTVLPPGAPARP
ncbi:MAG TPA: hypothetical protein VGN84_02725 [Solirubrobacterales bacterium]|nr:hypothetical protein [Solirubrobacterales bacterium]